jgi:flagellar hook-associated protein 3 FlgL
MRVNPNLLPDLISEISQTQQQINTDLGQISSGKSVTVPSDDPSAAAELVRNAAQTAAADQYLRSIGSVQGEMQTADATLSSVTTTLQRAISLGVEGANGTLNDADRASIVTELQGIQSQLVGLANLSYQGNYVFAGTATETAPYVVSGSVVTYAGNSSTNSVTLGEHFKVQTNLPGSELFSAPGSDVFQALQDLITGLQSNTGISAAVTEVSNASSYIDSQRVFYGNVENQLNQQQTYLNTDTTQLAQQQNTLGAADLPAVITNLTSAETSHQATLEAIGQTQQTNLFSYLK